MGRELAGLYGDLLTCMAARLRLGPGARELSASSAHPSRRGPGLPPLRIGSALGHGRPVPRSSATEDVLRLLRGHAEAMGAHPRLWRVRHRKQSFRPRGAHLTVH